MQFDWWTFGLQIINITVLIWLLNHFLFRPVAGVIARRKAETDRVLEDAEKAQKAAKEAQAAAQKRADEITTERLGILEAAKAEAAVQTKAILAQAREEEEKITADAAKAAKLVQEREKQREQRKSRELAVAIAQKLLANLPEGEGVTGYLARLKQAIGELDDERKTALFADDGAIEVVSAHALSKSEMAAVKAIVKSVTGKAVPLKFATDPDLVAGLELHSRHGEIHNSLKADVKRIQKVLEANEQN